MLEKPRGPLSGEIGLNKYFHFDGNSKLHDMSISSIKTITKLLEFI